MIDIKSIVKGGETVEFSHYFDGSLWYTTSNGDVFPVPLEDVGTATFNKQEKAILMMRYMRKANKVEGEIV